MPSQYGLVPKDFCGVSGMVFTLRNKQSLMPEKPHCIQPNVRQRIPARNWCWVSILTGKPRSKEAWRPSVMTRCVTA